MYSSPRRTGSVVSALKFAVLVAGHASPYCKQTYGDYGKLCTKLLKEKEEIWDVYNVVDDEFPTRDQIVNYDGFVVSGSRHDAHANQPPFIPRLRELLHTIYYEYNAKLLGFCFGHQVMAMALGGSSGRADNGWQVGIQKIVLDTDAVSRLPWFRTAQPINSLNCLQIHRDEVLEIPADAILLGSSKETKYEIFAIGDRVLCLQGHPEFNSDILRELVVSRRDAEIVPSSTAQNALKTLETISPDTDELCRLSKLFLKFH